MSRGWVIDGDETWFCTCDHQGHTVGLQADRDRDKFVFHVNRQGFCGRITIPLSDVESVLEMERIKA